MDLTDIFRYIHSSKREYIFFSGPDVMFSKIGYILEQNRYEKIEI